MKAFMYKITKIFLTVSSLLLLPGCWDYESIANRASVIGMGVDPSDNDPQKILITIQYPILSQSGGQTEGAQEGGTGSTSSFKNLSTECYSISEGLRQLQQKMDHQIDMAQLRDIVVSSKLSPKMMGSAIAQTIRMPKMNRLAFLCTTNDSARDVMSVKGTDTSPMEFLVKAKEVHQRGFILQKPLWQYWRDENQIGIEPVIAMVKVGTDKDTGKDTLELNGSEAYKHNQPTIELNPYETFYLNMLSAKVRDMALDVPVKGGVFSLEELRSNNGLEVKGTPDNLTLIDHISVRATLGKVTTTTEATSRETDLRHLEQQASNYLENQLTSTLKKFQAQKDDVVGFGRIYLQRHPEDDTKMKQEWNDVFSRAKLDIKVNVAITSRGMLI